MSLGPLVEHDLEAAGPDEQGADLQVHNATRKGCFFCCNRPLKLRYELFDSHEPLLRAPSKTHRPIVGATTVVTPGRCHASPCELCIRPAQILHVGSRTGNEERKTSLDDHLLALLSTQSAKTRFTERYWTINPISLPLWRGCDCTDQMAGSDHFSIISRACTGMDAGTQVRVQVLW